MSSFVGQTSGAPANAGAFQITLPTYAAGDRCYLFVSMKTSSATVPTIDQGWQLVDTANNMGTGIQGNDTGTMRMAIYAKTMGASETAPTVTPGATAPTTWEWSCHTARKGTNKRWRDVIAAASAYFINDTNTASPQTGSTAAFNTVNPGDAVIAVAGQPTDTGTALGSATITATGLTGGTVDATSTNYVENALGTDSCMAWAKWTGFTGTQTGQFTVSITVTSSTNHAGPIAVVTVREEDIPAPGNPTATTVSSSAIDVNFDDVTGATSYQVERSADGSTGWTQVYSGATSAFSDTGLTASTTYYYRAKVTTADGASAYTSVVSATTSALAGTSAFKTVVRSGVTKTVTDSNVVRDVVKKIIATASVIRNGIKKPIV